MRYRPDIDGLRAVSVSAIVLYHAGFSAFSGGFVGVDIFFVISGYLIISALISDLNQSKFSFLDFYERRIRRILPALFVMVAACCIAAFIILLPTDLKDFGQSVMATSLFVTNILFWKQAGYFDRPGESKPLLHTWSLSVEEQFYIVIPIVLVIIARLANRRFERFLPVILVVSFALSVWAVATRPNAAFYLAPFRAWEFLAGSLAAANSLPPLRSARFSNLLGIMGVVLLIGSIFGLSKETPFPGIAALPPCAGALLLIYSGASANTYSARMLSFRPVVFIGLISYSLYLWHWPIIVFFKYLYGYRLSTVHSVLLVIASVAAATLSWRFVEIPFRKRSGSVPRLAVFGVPAGVGLCALLIGALFFGSSGFADRLPGDVRAILSVDDYPISEPFREAVCFLNTRADRIDFFDAATCLKGDDHKPNVILVGDSHAAHFWKALSIVFADKNISQVTASGCHPLIDSRGAARCTQLMHLFFDSILVKNHPDAVVLSAEWDIADLESLVRTVDYAKRYAAKVYVFGPIVQYEARLPDLLARTVLSDRQDLPSRSQLSEQKATDALFRDRLVGDNVVYVSVYQTICPKDVCQLYTAPNTPIQFDESHLTVEGAKLLAQRWKDAHLIQ
jgi:peptidoglycan/LPS O-acetylase OafA/YrhL